MVSSSLVCGGVGVWELDESNGWNMARVSKGRADLNTEQHGEEKLLAKVPMCVPCTSKGGVNITQCKPPAIKPDNLSLLPKTHIRLSIHHVLCGCMHTE